jgi:hypothetical protein
MRLIINRIFATLVGTALNHTYRPILSILPHPAYGNLPPKPDPKLAKSGT